MPKILVSNLPVTTFINAEVVVDDGPEETLQERILAGVNAGGWERARGEHAEDYENLVLEVNREVVDHTMWSFETIGDVGETPAIPSSKDD